MDLCSVKALGLSGECMIIFSYSGLVVVSVSGSKHWNTSNDDFLKSLSYV